MRLNARSYMLQHVNALNRVFLVKALFCMLRFACKRLNRLSVSLFSVHVTCLDMKTREKPDHFKSLVNSFLALVRFYNEQSSDSCQHFVVHVKRLRTQN